MQKTGRITVRGIVQGVGFRPFVYAQACDLGNCGYGEKSRQRSGDLCPGGAV